MKAIFIFCLILFSLRQLGQDSLQQARLKSLQGKIAPFSFFAKKDSLFLICFWSVFFRRKYYGIEFHQCESGKLAGDETFSFYGCFG